MSEGRRAWRDFTERARLENDLERREQAELRAAVERGEAPRALERRGEFVHLVLTVCTGGLWAPVWIYVSLRNSRRLGRTEVGRTARQRRHEEVRALTEEQRRRNRVEAAQRWREAFSRRPRGDQ